MNKTNYLKLLEIYDCLQQKEISSHRKISCFRQLISIIHEIGIGFCETDAYDMLIAALSAYTESLSNEHWGLLLVSLCHFINTISDSYSFLASANVPYGRPSDLCEGKQTINADMQCTASTADILLSDDEITNAADCAYPVDSITYNRLFIEAKMKVLKEKPIKCIICGLSYTQYGFLEHKMPFPSVNLSVIGNDIPYSLLYARKALDLNPGIKYIVIPITYYQGFYDMTNDDSNLHKYVVARINTPILNNSRNYHGQTGAYIKNNSDTWLHMYDRICDLERIARDRDIKIIEELQNAEYYHVSHPMPTFGSLKFDFQSLTEQERYASAKISASLNERICTQHGYQETVQYLREFLSAPMVQRIKIIFFVPPMTKYLYAAYHNELKEAYYEKIVPLLKEYTNTRFYDLADSTIFTEEDFVDFDHLTVNSGALKLTDIIGEWVQLS